MHKVSVNTYLFLITPTCFDTQVSSSGPVHMLRLQANLRYSIKTYAFYRSVHIILLDFIPLTLYNLDVSIITIGFKNRKSA